MAKKRRKRDKRRRPRIRARTLRRWLVGGGILIGVVALSAVCVTAFGGGDGGQEVVISGEGQVKVDIRDFTFQPEDLTIEAGTEIVWENRDRAPHTATAEGDFDSGTLRRGDSYSVTFDKPGTYRYICAIHPYMTAKIVVTERAEQPTASPVPNAS